MTSLPFDVREVFLMGCIDHRHAVFAGRTKAEATLNLLEADASGLIPAECDWQIITLFLRPQDEENFHG